MDIVDSIDVAKSMQDIISLDFPIPDLRRLHAEIIIVIANNLISGVQYGDIKNDHTFNLLICGCIARYISSHPQCGLIDNFIRMSAEDLLSANYQ